MTGTVDDTQGEARADGDLPLPRLLAGDLALDFVNTVEWRGRVGSARGEHLVSYEALLRWSERAGVLRADAAAALARTAHDRPDAAQDALLEAIELREALAELLPAAADASGSRSDLTLLNAVLAAATAGARLVPRADRYAWAWPVATARLDAPTWPIARAAADLLTSEVRPWVRACANAECGWLFLDDSRGHRRRWCSMASCGNRAKARRHYARTRAGTGDAT